MSCGEIVTLVTVKCLLFFVLFSSVVINGLAHAVSKRKTLKKVIDYRTSEYINDSSELVRPSNISLDIAREETVRQTKRILNNTANITNNNVLTRKKTSSESDSHIPDDCDPFINENGCLSVIQKDDIYIKIINTDSEMQGKKQYYTRVDKHFRNPQWKRKPSGKNKRRRKRKNRDRNGHEPNSSVNESSGKKKCQTKKDGEKCSGSTDLNFDSKLDTKLPGKYWTVPKFVLALREKLIGKIKQLYGVLRNGIGETIRQILHSFDQIHNKYKELKEESRDVLESGHEVILDLIDISGSVYETMSSINEFTRRLYSRKGNNISPLRRRANQYFRIINFRNRHQHSWDTLKALENIQAVKAKINFNNRFFGFYDYNHFYEKIYLLKEHSSNQRTRLIDLLDISRQVNYTLRYYPHLTKLTNASDIPILNRDLMDEHYNIKIRIRTIIKDLNILRMLQTSCWLKVEYLSKIDFSAALKRQAANQKPLTEAQKRQVRNWASQVSGHYTDIDEVMEVIDRELQPVLHAGRNIILRFRNGNQNDKTDDSLERLRKKVHYWSILKRFKSSKKRNATEKHSISDHDDGRGDGDSSQVNKWNRWLRKKKKYFKKLRSRRRREVRNADQGSGDSNEDIELRLREIIKKLDDVWANILRFLNKKKVCNNGQDLDEGSGNVDMCEVEGSNEDGEEDLTTSNVDEDGFEFVDSKGYIPVSSSKRLLGPYLKHITDFRDNMKSRSKDVHQDIQDLKPDLVHISSSLSRTEKLSGSTSHLQNHVMEFLSNRTRYLAELKETTAELDLILTKVDTMNALAEKVLADEDNLRKLLEERKKELEKKAKEKKKVLKKKKKRQRDTPEALDGKSKSKNDVTNGDIDKIIFQRKNKKETSRNEKGRRKMKNQSESDISLGDGESLSSSGMRTKTDKHSHSNKHTTAGNRQNKKIDGQRNRGNSDVVEEEDRKVKKRKKERKRKINVKNKQAWMTKNKNVEEEKKKKKEGNKDKETIRLSGRDETKKENWLDVWEGLMTFENSIQEKGNQEQTNGDGISGHKYNGFEHDGKATPKENGGRRNMLGERNNEKKSGKEKGDETNRKKLGKEKGDKKYKKLGKEKGDKKYKKLGKEKGDKKNKKLGKEKDDKRNEKKGDNRNEKKPGKGKDGRNKGFKIKKIKSKNDGESERKSGSETSKKTNWLDFWENLVESEELLKKSRKYEAGSEDITLNEKSKFQNDQSVVEDVEEMVSLFKKDENNYEKEQEKDIGLKNSKNVYNVTNIQLQRNVKNSTKEGKESKKNKLKLKIKRLKRYRRDLRNSQNSNNSLNRKRDARRRRRQMKRKRKLKLHKRGQTNATWQSDKADDDEAVIKFFVKTTKQIEIDVAKSKQEMTTMNKTLQELPKDLHKSVLNNVQQLRLNISQIQHKIHLARTLLSAMKIPVKLTGKDHLIVPLHPRLDSRKIQSAMDVCVKPKMNSGAILAVKANNSVSYILGLQNSAVFLTVYDKDGNQLKKIESKFKTKPNIWYMFGIQRIGRNFSMMVNPISVEEKKKEVVKLFLPKINAEHVSPSVAYIGGYPEELWKNKLKQLEGCVGSVDIDGHSLSLMQPLSDASQPTPCPHGCSDSSSMVFEGNGFAEFQVANLLKNGLTSIQFSFKTHQTDVLLLFLKNTNFLLVVTMESGNIHIQYELEDTQTAKLSGVKKLSNGILHKLQISFKNGKFSAGMIDEKLKFTDAVYRSVNSEVETGFLLGGLSPHYQNNTTSQYRSLTGCLSNIWLNHKEVSLLQLEDTRHVHLGNCENNLWISCSQFTKNSKPINLPDFASVKSISVKVSHQANGVALFFKRKSKFAIEVKLQDSLVEIMNHETDDSSKISRNSSNALWNIITVDDEMGNLHISLDGQRSVDMKYKEKSGWFSNDANDFSMSITIGGVPEKYQTAKEIPETLDGSISSVLVENILINLKELGVSNHLDVCSKPVDA